ncbi:uncharacterized protein KQ657_003120 [Scheffersomyces spartinae]|uniref:Dynein intermediate chain n=1 Tax=Scheffersomyces spartinae TaxID=45513 RepID=A0A9P7V5C7_9ASCO|nr:uncharacterized protein KQ657_003120 [Scheffersomyces spartinae]KAG7191445.1 hypothetical protein KQ657_003120 [Scheffersomyces spartinae]
MDSERQSLLEQKRQRLQELKRRRQLGSPSKEINLLDVDNILETTPGKVDIAIQTDTIIEDKDTVANSDTVVNVRFKKHLEDIQCNQGIQTVESFFESIEEIEHDDGDDDGGDDGDDGDDDKATVLDTQIEDSNAALKSLYQEEIQEPTVFDEYDVSFTANGTNTDVEDFNPFKLLARIEANSNVRAIAGIDVSARFPGLVVVSYARCDSPHQLNGLAKVYNFDKNPPTTEFVLECDTSICQIQFDHCNNKRVIAGLADGRIVIWDLNDPTNRQSTSTETEYIVLPSISSPHPNATDCNNNSAHNSGISSLTQLSIENNDSIVITTYSGMVSLWSTSILASPKCSSINIVKTSTKDDTGNVSTENIGIEGVVALRGDLALQEASFAIDQHKFLSNLVVLSSKGNLYRLGNDMELIKSVYQSETKTSTGPGESLLPTSLSSFLEGKYFITTHLDSSLKLWMLTNPQPLLEIPTKDLIIGLAVRPHYDFQFVTLALSLTPIVQFWDLKVRMRSPIVDIVITEATSPTKIAFDSDGKQLVVGFLDGSVSLYEIDETILKDTSRLRRNLDIDSGLQDMY